MRAFCVALLISRGTIWALFVYGDRDVKRLAWLGVILTPYILVGCDIGSTQPKKLTIAEMIATGKEEAGSQCSNGDVSLKCEFLSGDLTGSGKWHHTQVFVSKSGAVDLIVDGEKFKNISSDGKFASGTNYAIYHFKSPSSKTAVVTISNDNAGASMNIEASNKDGKKILIGNR